MTHAQEQHCIGFTSADWIIVGSCHRVFVRQTGVCAWPLLEPLLQRGRDHSTILHVCICAASCSTASSRQPPPFCARAAGRGAPLCSTNHWGRAAPRGHDAGGRTAQMGPRGPLGHGNGAPTSNGSIRGHQPARRGYGALAAAVRGPSFHMDMFAVAAWLNQRRSSGHANGPAPQPPAQTLARPRYRSGCCSCR